MTTTSISRGTLRWDADCCATGRHNEYRISERSPQEFPLYVRAKGETAYTETGVHRSLTAAKVAAYVAEHRS